MLFYVYVQKRAHTGGHVEETSPGLELCDNLDLETWAKPKLPDFFFKHPKNVDVHPY